MMFSGMVCSKTVSAVDSSVYSLEYNNRHGLIYLGLSLHIPRPELAMFAVHRDHSCEEDWTGKPSHGNAGSDSQQFILHPPPFLLTSLYSPFC